MTEGAVPASRLNEGLALVHRQAVSDAIRDVERRWPVDRNSVGGLAVEVAVAEVALAAHNTREED